MSKLMTVLDKLGDFEKRLQECDRKMNAAVSDPTTTISTVTAIKELADSTAKEFNDWMNNEFKFADGPVIMPTILKTVLENTCEPKRIIV